MDYTFTDRAQHTYYAHICGRTNHYCLPAEWTNTYEYGVAIQTWGATPPCQTPPSCKNHNGSAACCTADCQVLGAGAPKWSLIDPRELTTTACPPCGSPSGIRSRVDEHVRIWSC